MQSNYEVISILVSNMVKEVLWATTLKDERDFYEQIANIKARYITKHMVYFFPEEMSQ